MLIAEPTRFGAGAIIYGDALDLRSLHETVQMLAEGCGFNDDVKETFTTLAFDIQQAYEGNREHKVFRPGQQDEAHHFGFKALWPALLFKVPVLQATASDHAASYAQQLDLDCLQSSIETALLAYDQATGKRCCSWLKTPLIPPSTFCNRIILDVAYRYLDDPATGKARFRRLPGLLKDLLPDSARYQLIKRVEKAADQICCNCPHLEDTNTPWPPFQW